MTGRVKAGALLAAGALGTGAAIAIGSVPDGDGTFHACYAVAAGGGGLPAAGPNVRVIDPTAQTCDAASEHAFTFSAQGPQGAQGIQGPPGEQGVPGAAATGTIEQPETAGHAALTFPGGRTRTILGGSTLQFDVLSIGYSVTGPAAKGAGFTTRGSPPPALHVTRATDKYSAALEQACASGKRLSKVVLSLYGGKEVFTLTNAYLTSVQFAGSHTGGADDREELDEFVAEKVTTQYAGGGSSSNTLPILRYAAKTQLKL